MNRKRTLIVAADPEAGLQIEEFLRQETCELEVLQSWQSAVSRVERAPLVDAVVLNLLGMDGDIDWIESFRQARPPLKIVALLPNGDSDVVVRAVQMGADVCVWQPYDQQSLQRALEKCMAPTLDRAPGSELPGDVEELDDGGFFVMASPAMRKLRAQVAQVAKADVPVLLLGESGTGKEVVARLMHRLSLRSQRPFLKVNCAAVPGELLESELFGYERGAFTGAVRSKPGKLEACNHGTLFLDEIAEMPPALQAKLLHVLQDQEFSRLGSCSRIRVNLRVLAATNANVREAIAAKMFRDDLYYRLSTFVFTMPPLRDRKEDIPVLLGRYMAHYAAKLALPPRVMTPRLWQSCLQHSWPGNVRELENLAKRYLICGEEAIISALSPHPARQNSNLEPNGGPDSTTGDFKSRVRTLRNEAEAEEISRALEQTNWNRKETATVLHISYKAVLSKIRQYGLDQVPRKTLEEYQGQEDVSRYPPLVPIQSEK